MSAPRTIATLSSLRQQLDFALALQMAAARRQEFHVMASEGERIAWLQRRIDELEVSAGAAHWVAGDDAAAVATGGTPDDEGAGGGEAVARDTLAHCLLP